MRSSSDAYQSHEIVLLHISYQQAQNEPWFRHLWGELLLFREELRDQILAGKFDAWGNDLNHGVRLCLRVVEDILATPEKVKDAREKFEEMHNLKLAGD